MIAYITILIITIWKVCKLPSINTQFFDSFPIAFAVLSSNPELLILL